LHFPNPCTPGNCFDLASWAERLPFLLLLGTLQVLHVMWFGMMLRKGYREIYGKKKGGGVNNADD
jgi:hypothetical protein